MNNFQTPSLKMLRRILTILAALIGFGLLTAGPAHASSGDFYFGKWFVTLAFPNNQPLVELTTEIWYKPASSAAYLVTAQTEALSCTVTGNLPVSSERATFTGQSYIACDQPDMVQKFYDVSQGALNNVPYNVPARNPYVTGELVVAGNSVNETQPAYYHPSLQYGLIRTSATQAQQVLRVDGAASSSSSFVQVWPYTLRSEFQIQANGSYKTQFTANGVASSGTPATLGSGLEVNLAATTIYFGYSPANGGSYFQGSMGTLTIDPGAFGRG